MDDQTEAPPPPAPHPAVEAFDSALAEWLAASIRNSPVSRHTDAVNHLNAALPKLRAGFVAKLHS